MKTYGIYVIISFILMIKGERNMSVTIEGKFDNLLEIIISSAEIHKPLSRDKKKEIDRAKAIQIIMTTFTTILLGLKLGGITTSLAFISSTVAMAFTVWYNIEDKSKEYSSVLRYSTLTTSLAREILFYRNNVAPLEEEKFQEYAKKFFNIKEEFEIQTISLAEDLLKKDQNSLKT